MRILLAAFCTLLLSLPVGATVHDQVFQSAQACSANARSLEEQRYCMIKATPRKCREHLRGPPSQFQSLPMRQVWMKCLGSCEGANLFSRTFGECSTPSDPNK